MSIENITAKILSEANDAASAIIENANAESAKIINEAKNKAAQIINEAATNTDAEADTLKQRKVSAAELESRKILLSAKQEMINKSFEQALMKLSTLPEDKYLEYLLKEITKTSLNEGELILNKEDKINIGEKIVKIVNEKTNGNITLSSNTITASGGFVLKNGNIEINSTFESIISSIKDELTFEVANVIFK